MPRSVTARRAPKTKPARENGAGANPATAWPGRAGRINVTGYFDPSVRSSLRLIQAKLPRVSVQELLAEALNLLFAKYDVPQAAPKRGSDS